MHNIKPGKLMNTEVIKEPDNKKVLKILYKNWKGEVTTRNVIPNGNFYWGSTEFHKQEQWLLDVYDLDKAATRTYAFKDIKYIFD